MRAVKAHKNFGNKLENQQITFKMEKPLRGI